MKEILIFCINSLWITALIGSLIGLIVLSIGALIGNLIFYISEFIKKKIKNFKHRCDKHPTGIWYYYKGCKHFAKCYCKDCKYHKNNREYCSFTKRHTKDNWFCSWAERNGNEK